MADSSSETEDESFFSPDGRLRQTIDVNEPNDNPYAAPAANIRPELSTDSGFDPFPRFSAWWVFLLGVITLGVYFAYWLFSRTQVINRHYPEIAISPGLVWTAIAFYVGDWAVTFIQIVQAFTDPTMSSSESAVIVLGGAVVSLMAWVMVIAWSMTIRSKLIEISSRAPGIPADISAVITAVAAIFFVAPIYLAYKINQQKDGF